MVLLKQHDARGFWFYTNYDSQKARELAANPRAALCFWWNTLERSVRVCGTVTRASSAESTAYWASRPRGSQMAATASLQSTVVASRAALHDRFQSACQEYEGCEVLPRPEGWGGYIVMPLSIEFWAGQPSRFHDRIRYTRDEVSGLWHHERLMP